jgi:RNA polymerase sigma-70 factor, ECF subfamily
VTALAKLIPFPDAAIAERSTTAKALATPVGGSGLDDVKSEIAAHIASLRRYARALMRDRSDAEDLMQEALARALSRSHQYRPGTNLRAWLFTILHNIHVNQVRAKVVRPNEVPVEDHEHRLSTPARQDGRIELRDMARAIETLPAEQRQVLLLVGLEGMKYDEVAKVLGVPIGTVMSRLSRAREAVRTRLAEGPAETGPTLRRIK